MRKHYKLVSSIACIVLCIAIVAFGVYAASNSLVRLSATVSFTPSTAQLTIIGGISGSTQSIANSSNSNDKLKYYATNHGTSTNVKEEKDNVATFNPWEYENATFNDKYFEQGKTEPDPIYFLLQITNHIERDVDIKVDFTKVFDENLKVSCLYNITNKTTLSSTDDKFFTGATTPLQATVDTLAGKTYTSKNSDITYSESGAEIDFSSEDMTLSTIMIVIKLEVRDQAESVTTGEFNFTVSII